MSSLGQTANVFAIPSAQGAPNIVTVSPSSMASQASPVQTDVTGTHLTFLGWGVLLLSLYGLNHTGAGHEIIFYSLVLIALFMFAANYKSILPLLTTGGQ